MKRCRELYGKPMKCPCCRKCFEALDKYGNPTGHCITGGPHSGYMLAEDAYRVMGIIGPSIQPHEKFWLGSRADPVPT